MSGVRIACGFCGIELRRGQDCPTCAPKVERDGVTRFERVVSTAIEMARATPPLAGEKKTEQLARCLFSSSRAFARGRA